MEDFIPKENEGIIIERKLRNESLQKAVELKDLNDKKDIIEGLGQDIPEDLEKRIQELDERVNLLRNMVHPPHRAN